MGGIYADGASSAHAQPLAPKPGWLRETFYPLQHHFKFRLNYLDNRAVELRLPSLPVFPSEGVGPGLRDRLRFNQKLKNLLYIANDRRCLRGGKRSGMQRNMVKMWAGVNK